MRKFCGNPISTLMLYTYARPHNEHIIFDDIEREREKNPFRIIKAAPGGEEKQ